LHGSNWLLVARNVKAVVKMSAQAIANESRALAPIAFGGVVVIDTREQCPYAFRGLVSDARTGRHPLIVPTVVAGLPSGDYSLQGFESRIAVERKSLADLFNTLGQNRGRFQRELERLAQLNYAAVVIEGDWRSILGAWPEELFRLLDWLEEQAYPPAGQRQQQNVAKRVELSNWYAALNRILVPASIRSQLNPVTVYRSIIAWQERFPKIHWWPCPDRWFAERTTFRLLERFWRDEELRKNRAARSVAQRVGRPR